MEHGTWDIGLGTWYIVMVHGTWDMAEGTWDMGPRCNMLKLFNLYSFREFMDYGFT